MKRLNFIQGIALLTLLAGLVTACSNDRDNTGTDNYGYISLFPFIGQNRITGNSFETDDAIGVFIVPYNEDNTTPGEINSSDYATNVQFTYNGSSWNTSSDNQIRWPGGGRNIDAYAYFPYDEAISIANSREYYFSVNEDQQTKAGYEFSDFLWAKRSSVSPTRDPVALSFSHIMSKIRINVKAEVETLEGQVPYATVTIVNTKEAATVDLSDGGVAVDNLSVGNGVIAFRHSTPTIDYLLSSEAILIPQTIIEGTALLHIDMPGTNTRYTYTPTDDIIFEAGKERTFNITITRLGLSVTVGSITDWQESEIIEGEIGKPMPKVLDMNDIDWNSSLVQDIYDNGVRIGQISREYLFQSDVVDAQAIVVYAMADNGQIDESIGFVAQVMNRTRNATTNIYEPNTQSIHGGTVVWASANAMDSYTAGTLALFNKIEISSTGIHAAADNAITSLNVVPYKLVDIDGNSYSIVKISSQYWMAENLKTERYRDGSAITHYYYNDNTLNKELFGALYTWTAITDSRGIGPEGWSVPANDMFISLYRYLTPDAGRKLKANILWSNLNYNDNVTGFNGLPGGRRTDGGTYNEIYNYGQWWSATATSTANAYRLYLDYGNNAMHNTNINKNYTQSIRLLRD